MPRCSCSGANRLRRRRGRRGSGKKAKIAKFSDKKNDELFSFSRYIIKLSPHTHANTTTHTRAQVFEISITTCCLMSTVESRDLAYAATLYGAHFVSNVTSLSPLPSLLSPTSSLPLFSPSPFSLLSSPSPLSLPPSAT